MKCPTCNFENSYDSKFCCGCGRPFPCCPTCGNILTTRDRFCVHDGTRLPDELLVLVPEESEEVVEEVDVVQDAATDKMPPFDEIIQAPVANAPTSYCLSCGSPLWHEGDYCAACRKEMLNVKDVCASCGMPCEPGEDYCSYCRPTKPVPVENMDYVPPVTHKYPSSKKKKKNGSVLTAILVILLLLLIGAAAVMVAAEFDLIELPDFLASEDSEGKGRYRPQKNDPTTETTDPATAPITAPTTEPTTTPTTAPTTAPTEPTTKPTQPAQTKLEYFMENCDSQYFTRADIVGFTKEECWYARNACYAQAGRKFNNKELQRFFEQYYWYTPIYEPDDFESYGKKDMNDYARKNRELISNFEKEMGYQ